MATDAIDASGTAVTTGEDEPMKPSMTTEEATTEPQHNNDPSTPEPVKELPLRRSNRGKGRSDRGNHGDERVQSCVFDSVEYKPSDYVYFEEADSDCYAIGTIDEIKLSRREKCTLVVKYFWRTFDVPDVSKQALLDRESADKGDPRILARELFITDLQTSIDSSFLRGKCSVAQFPELINALESFDPTVEDSFYYVYAFNPESKRLLSIRAEIKIGPAYQATWLPPYRGTHPITHRCDKHNSVLNRLRETQNTTPEAPVQRSLKRPHCCLEASRTSAPHCEHVCLLRVEESPPKQWEQLIWHPEGLETSIPYKEEVDEVEGDAENEGVRSEFADRRLKTYLDAVRSLVAIFAFGGADDDLISAENGHVVANLVATTQHAYDTLHACGYDVARALEAIRDNPVISLDTPQHWTAEQVRRFYAAIKVHGKNFHAIHKDYFSPTTAVDPITGIGGGAVVEALLSRNARGRKRRGNTQVDAKTATPVIADPDMIKKEEEEDEEEEEEGDGKPECEAKEEVKNTEGNDEDAEDEEMEDVKNGDGEMCRPTRVLFRPTREKTVKQLVTFYYYWKRKSTSNITSAAAHAAAVAAAAAAAAVNTGAPFRGSTVEANFNRGFATGKKRKTPIIDCPDAIATNTTNPPESENEETGVDTPRTDLAASPTDATAIATEVAAEGEETLRASDDSTEVTRLCRNCCIEPIEPPSTSQPTPQKHHQADVEKPVVTHICAKCRMHWRKYGELPKSSSDKASVPCKEWLEEVKKEPIVGKVSGEHATHIEAAESTTQQLQDGVISIENHRGKSMVATATKVTKMSGVEETTAEVPPDSVCSFCDVYSPTYASCWPSPLLKLEGASSDNKLYMTAAPPTTDSVTVKAVSPPPADQRPIAVTPEPVSAGDAAEVVAPCSSGINASKHSVLRHVWDRSIVVPSSLSSVSSASSASSEVHNFSSCSRTDPDFMAAVPAPEVQASQLAPFQSPQPNITSSLPPSKRFINYMASAATAAADFGASGFNFPFGKEQMQILMQQYLCKNSEASQQLQQQQQQQQQQPMELTAKARAPPTPQSQPQPQPPPPLGPPVSAHLPMSEPSLLASTKCFMPSSDQPLNLKGTIRATTHARGTFYPPTGVPPSGSAASMPRQQQQATSLQSIRGSGSGSSSGGAGRYSSTSGTALRPPPPPPPPLPFSGGLSGRPPSVTNSTRFQCGPGASTETIPTEPAYIDAFVKDQLIASSMARSGNFQQLQHHQQSQQQRSPVAATGTAGKPVERVEKMNQMFANFAVGGGQKPSTLSPSQKQQQHTRDPTMDAAAAAAAVAAAAATGSTFRPQTAAGEARTSDAMHRYQLAYQQQQQWQQQMQQLQRFLQAATPQQQQQVMMLLFSQIQQQQQQLLQQQQQQTLQQSTTTTNRLTQPPAAFHHHHHQHQSSMPSSFPPPPLSAPALPSQYRMQNSGAYSQQSQPKARIPPLPSVASSSSTASLASVGPASTSTSSTALLNSNSGFHRNASAFLSQQQQESSVLPQMQQPSPWPIEYYSNFMNFPNSKLGQMTQLTQFLKLYDAPNPAIVAAAVAAAANAVDSTSLRHQQHQHLQQQQQQQLPQQQQQQQQEHQHLRSGGGSGSVSGSSTQPPPQPQPQPPQASASAPAPSRGAISLQETEALSELIRLIVQHRSPQSTSGHHHHLQQ